MLSSHEISVVVQGPIVGGPNDPPERRLTSRCVASVRRALPQAEIVLSTYRGADLEGLTYDVLVESDDPGGHLQNDLLRVWNNCNRQITTTRAGLQRASGQLAMKLRSDMELTGAEGLKHFGRYSKRCPEWHIFEERLLACTVYSRNPRLSYCYPLHPSDWFFFGRREDMLRLWNIPLQPEPETSRWFETRPRPEPDLIPSNLFRYAPEQYLWVSCLRTHGEVRFEHCHDFSHDPIRLTEMSFANNLVLLEPWQLRVRFLKYQIHPQDWPTLYTHGDWLRMYQRYCDSSLQPGIDWTRARRRLAGHARQGLTRSQSLLARARSGLSRRLRRALLG
ncbi:MAG: WavE lipopolysaccharide synthesis family protein [Planctomycetota bacterium]